MARQKNGARFAFTTNADLVKIEAEILKAWKPGAFSADSSERAKENTVAAAPLMARYLAKRVHGTPALAVAREHAFNLKRYYGSLVIGKENGEEVKAGSLSDALRFLHPDILPTDDGKKKGSVLKSYRNQLDNDAREWSIHLGIVAKKPKARTFEQRAETAIKTLRKDATAAQWALFAQMVAAVAKDLGMRPKVGKVGKRTTAKVGGAKVGAAVGAADNAAPMVNAA
jgi:hypothetical protein